MFTVEMTDTCGVSPVIGVLMLIGTVSEVPCTALVEEGVGGGTNVNVTLTHYCGDMISDAFNTSPWPELGDT